MRLTWNIKIVLRKDKAKADGYIPLYYSIRVGPFTNRVPTGKCTKLSDWDEKNGAPKGSTKLNQALGTYLNGRMQDWRTYMMELQALSKPVTLTIACNFFNENTKVTFYDFFQEQINLWEFEKAENTLKSYRSTLNILKEFAPKLSPGDVTYEFIQKFDIYMSKVRGNAQGGKFTKHKCCKTVIREAIKKGLLPSDQNPYRFFKIKAAVGKREFLTIDEVTQLMNLEIPEKNGFLNKVKDLFLMGCYTGLRYSDIMNLKWQNINTEKGTITVNILKTNKHLTIPLLPQASTIMDKYGKFSIKTPMSKVLPQMTNQVINRELKELIKALKINKSISFHCARHTFASNLIESKANILFVRDLLGHKNLADTQIYAKTLQTDLNTTMNTLSSMYG